MTAAAAANIKKLLPLQGAKVAGRLGQEEDLYSDHPSLLGLTPEQAPGAGLLRQPNMR
jgi:hypothetical protein